MVDQRADLRDYSVDFMGGSSAGDVHCLRTVCCSVVVDRMVCQDSRLNYFGHALRFLALLVLLSSLYHTVPFIRKL